MPCFKEYKGERVHWARTQKPKPTGRIIQSSKRTDFWVRQRGEQVLSYKKLTDAEVRKLKLKTKPRQKTSLEKQLRKFTFG